MAEIRLPEKEAFYPEVQTISKRIGRISENNTMAQLLHSNFKNWLQTSSVSPVQLTKDLDADNNGLISGEEFAGLLGAMTGERPPDWVVELVFSFVKADTSKGIPIVDWMAFLAASGLEIPDDLFEQPVVITGSLLIHETTVNVGDSVTVHASFNEPVDAYETKVTNTNTGQTEAFVTNSDEMDSPTFDEFVLESDEEGVFRVELLHHGVRLDESEFTALAVPEPPEETEMVEQAQDEHHAPSAPAVAVEEHGFPALLERLAEAKLRSDTEQIIGQTSPYAVNFTVKTTERTLMGTEAYTGGSTLTCRTDDGAEFAIMMKSDDRVFSKGEHLHAVVVPHAWSVALRRLVCREQ